MIIAQPTDINACYRILLGREADPGGLKFWGDVVNGGSVTTTELAFLFMGSAEFAQIQRAKQAAAEQLERVELRELELEMDVAPAWNPIHRGIASSRVWEPHITRQMMKLSLTGKVFVDCGANIGYYTLLAARRGAECWAFEPNARNVWFLLRNLALNQLEAKVYPYAVADRERVMFYNGNEGNGQVEEYAGQMPTVGQEVIRTVTLDDVLDGVAVDVIKLDIEGAEWLALSGAPRVLQRRPTLFLEFSPSGLQGISKVEPLDLLNHFIDRQYSIEIITEDGLASHGPEETVEVARNLPGSFADLLLRPL